MSRRAAEVGFETFVTRAAEATRREFRVGRALRGTGLGPGGAVVDRLRRNADALERRVVEPELAAYRRRSVDQFGVVLDAVERGEPIERFEEALLAHDSYVRAIDPGVAPDRRQRVVDDVLARLDRLGEGVVPIVEQPEDEFWPAVRAAFDRETAVDLVETAFPFTEPLRRHRDAFTFAVVIDPGDVFGGAFARRLPSVSVDYTDEAIRAMRRAEQRIVHETRREVERRFAS